jgi:hypothetical protein
LVKIVANASLSEAIKQNDEIKGIQIPNTDREAKMFSHADDKTLILSDPTSIKETFEVFDLYGKVSGVKLIPFISSFCFIASLKEALATILTKKIICVRNC